MLAKIPREKWVSALTAHPPATIKAVASECTRNCRVTHRALPQEGLFLLRMRESVMGEDFFLGEIPVSSAWVELHMGDGRVVEGAAKVLADSRELAVALAVCDAVAAHALEGSEQVAALIEQGLEKRRETERKRAAMRARTAVDFSLLTAE